MHVLPTNVSLPQDHPMPDMSCVYGQSRLGHTYNSWSGAFIEGYAAVFLGYHERRLCDQYAVELANYLDDTDADFDGHTVWSCGLLPFELANLWSTYSAVQSCGHANDILQQMKIQYVTIQ